MGAPRLEGEAGQTRGIGMKRGTVIYASDDSPESVEDARGYIRSHGYTRDDVRLVKRDGQVLVIAERELKT